MLPVTIVDVRPAVYFIAFLSLASICAFFFLTHSFMEALSWTFSMPSPDMKLLTLALPWMNSRTILRHSRSVQVSIFSAK